LTLKPVRQVIKDGTETLDIAPTITRPNLIYVKGKGGDYGVDDWRDVRGVWRVLSPGEEIPEDANTRTEPDPAEIRRRLCERPRRIPDKLASKRGGRGNQKGSKGRAAEAA
jgi:hypothetical protein